MKVKDKKDFDIWALQGCTPDEVYEELKIACCGLENPTFNYECYGYDGGAEFFFEFEREETDVERKAREKREAKDKANFEKQRKNIEERERKEYERLRKKYE